MGLLKRMFGRDTEAECDHRAQQSAIDRYRYLLRTAPPEAIEEAHAEAFASLTPEQRRWVLAELMTVTPENERPTSDDPESLARAATRAEMRRPGTLERSFGGAGPMAAGSLLAGIAGAFVGTTIATAVFSDLTDDGGPGGTGEADPGMGTDWSGDIGGGDFGGGF